jgi:DNA-binding NtrC family response regulator
MFPQIIGKSWAIRKIKGQISKLAKTEDSILICGETGVGKDLVAQNIYHQSNLVGKPFVKLNCAGLTESLSEIDLSCFEQADTKEESKADGQLFKKVSCGILYLDNIDLLSLAQQLEILSFLPNDSHQIIDLKAPVPLDARIICSTNQDLESLIINGKFSDRLYYRLSTVKIDIEPLRERPEDIPLLIGYYLKEYVSDDNDQEMMSLDKKTIGKLLAHHWPGNVRELQNVLKRIKLLERQGEKISDLISIKKNHHAIIEADKPKEVMPHSNRFSEFHSMHASELKSMPLKKARKKIVDMAEKELISNVLENTGWNRSKANKILDISYKTLLSKIKELNIQPSEQWQN